MAATTRSRSKKASSPKRSTDKAPSKPKPSLSTRKNNKKTITEPEPSKKSGKSKAKQPLSTKSNTARIKKENNGKRAVPAVAATAAARQVSHSPPSPKRPASADLEAEAERQARDRDWLEAQEIARLGGPWRAAQASETGELRVWNGERIMRMGYLQGRRTGGGRRKRNPAARRGPAKPESPRRADSLSPRVKGPVSPGRVVGSPGIKAAASPSLSPRRPAVINRPIKAESISPLRRSATPITRRLPPPPPIKSALKSPSPTATPQRTTPIGDRLYRGSANLGARPTVSPRHPRKRVEFQQEQAPRGIGMTLMTELQRLQFRLVEQPGQEMLDAAILVGRAVGELDKMGLARLLGRNDWED